MSEHTPGPWTAGTNEYGCFVVRSGTREIASVRVVNGLPNSRLIAAAPELLAAMVSLRGQFEKLIGEAGDMTDGSDDLQALTAASLAIDKAMGYPSAPAKEAP